MRPGPDNHDEALTQPIRRGVIPRLPGSLDPAARVDGGTEVMSLDELMDLASSSPAPAPVPAAAPAPAAVPAPAAAPAPATVASGPDVRDRVLADARQAYLGAMDRAGDWLRTGDNGLIAATAAVVALLLIVIVAV